MAQLLEELLQLVCEHFRPSGYTFTRKKDFELLSTLQKLCLTSKTTRRIAQPVMIHTLSFEDRPWSYVQSILNLLASQPHIAKFVRTIRVSGWKTYDQKHPPSSSSMLRVLQDAVQKLPVSQQIRTGLPKALVHSTKHAAAEFALLLGLCTKMELIEARLPGPFDSPWIERLMDDSMPSSSTDAQSFPFGQISDIRLSSDHGSIEVSNFEHLLQLSSLHKFQCYKLDSSLGGELPITSSTVQHIQLILPILDATGLDSMLSKFPNMKSLDLEWGHCFVFLVEDYMRWGDVLRRRGRNLEQLFIAVSDCEQDSDNLPAETLGDLSTLTKLTMLTLPFDSLCDLEHDIGDQIPLQTLLRLSLQTLNVWTYETRHTRSDIKGYLEVQLNQLMHNARYKDLTTINLDRVPLLKIDAKGAGWKLSRDEGGWASLNRIK